jgi:lipoyl(octanoyl) transferase
VVLPHKRGYLARMDRECAMPAWKVHEGLSPYAETVVAMEQQVERIALGEAAEEIWLVEHPPTLTAGTSAQAAELLQPERFPVVHSGRGGRFTYHGPGQRVIYPLLDLRLRGRDVRRYVDALEHWAVEALARLGIAAGTSPLGTGIWITRDGRPAKVGAIGVRVRRWISYHGMAINLTTDLGHYDAIVPCGIVGHGVTRVVDHKPTASMACLDAALLATLPQMLHRLSKAGAPDVKTLETARDCS